jgi:peptidyl-prolyl cis-trans isomerase SurA
MAKTVHSTVVDRVVAIVNQEVITLSELELANTQFENPLFRELTFEFPELPETPKLHDTLRILIEKKLQLQAAHKRGVTVRQEELQRILEEIKHKQGITNDAALQQLLDKENLTLSDYTQAIKDQLMILKLINQEIHSSVVLHEQEINAYYRAHPEQFRHPERIRLAQILISVPNNAKEQEVQDLEEHARKIRNQLLEDADFTSTARMYSDGPEANQGGDLGYFKKGELMKEIDKLAFSLQVGEISDVIRTPLGFHIFKLLEDKAAETITYEDAKSQIEERLLLEKTDMAYRLWLKRLRDQAYVELKM